jgi:hypothetical protein
MLIIQTQKTKNPLTNQGVIVMPSLADWDMSSGRNMALAVLAAAGSLADWDMSSGRNHGFAVALDRLSLADWDMSSGRNNFRRGRSPF